VGPPGHPFDVTQYARRIAIEPLAVAPEITDRIDPIVCINRDEQRPRGALRERFAVARDKRLVVVVHAGKPGETRAMLPGITRDEALVVLDLHAADALVPAAEWLADADVLHAAAGYNTFWEACWLGHFTRTHFTAFARPNDRQSERLGLALSQRTMRENGADALAAMLTR